MLIVLSPAKALDFETPAHVDRRSQPALLDEAETLVGVMRDQSPQQIAGLMKLSDQLASLNAARYQTWKRPFTRRNAKQAVLAFDGDVYGGLDARTLDDDDLAWAQQHLRILSGLYGVLRPLDLMQPYRLEMGTRLENPRGANLYRFWGRTIADELGKALKRQRGERVLVNLASEEYFKSVDRRVLGTRIVTPVFEDWKSGGYRVISFFAKRARGLMSRYAIEHRLDDVEALTQFTGEGYGFAAEASDGDRWVFRRRLG
ncbi:MAG: peroxide stress protein YaaA [Zoogloeaceae bacterium]|nr:peroxide stress protein YaaA [Rhodocyclaceae bacterium]MCP5235574.1 peroxide stress protein YaaA [Zoogloeaceae bacterium]